MNVLIRIVRRTSDWLAWLTLGAAIVTATAMVGSLLLGVFFRYVVQSSLTWSEEVAILGFTWTVFLMATIGVREDTHVRVTLIENALPAGGVWALRQLIWLVVAGVGVLMAVHGYTFMAFTMSQVSPALRYPSWLMNSAVPVAGALIVVHALAQLRLPNNASTANE